MRILTIDAGKLEPFEIGARLMAILAFPNASEVAELTAAQQALCTEHVSVTADADPELGDELRQRFPDYSKLDRGTIRKHLRKTRTRYRDRMVAARMARGFFQEALTKMPAVLPESMARLSLNELSKLVLSESGQSDSENVEKRAWRQSRPIIHLASAFDVYGSFTNPGGIDLPYDTQDLAAHCFLVKLSALHERIVGGDCRFGTKPNQLIRLAWRE